MNSIIRSFGLITKHSNLKSQISNLKSRTITRTAVWLLAGMTYCVLWTAIPGCKTPTHAEARVQAEQRWSQVRGQVKLQLARQQFERGLFEDTIKTLKEAMSLDPNSTEAYVLLAKSNLELGKSTTAGQVLGAAAKLGLVSAELHYLHGVVLEQRNELAAALSLYEKACALDPTKVMYLLAQVETLVALDRPGEALALVDANVNQFDDDASVALLGARIAVLMGDAIGALERFQNPAIQNAGSRIATEELGSLLASQGHCPEAIRILQPLCVLADGPEMSAGARRSLAECYLNGNEARLAINVLSEHAAANPTDGSSLLLLAKAALAEGEYMTALQAIELASRGKPKYADFKVLLAAIHWKRGDFSGAQSVLDDILSKNPADVDAWCLMGEVLNDLNRWEEAQKAFERALNLDPDCRWAAEQLAGPGGQLSPQRMAGKKIPKKS